MEQLDFIDEPGWRHDQREYPPAAEILKSVEANPNRHLIELCRQGLITAIAEKRLTPERAREYMVNWFGQDAEFQ